MLLHAVALLVALQAQGRVNRLISILESGAPAVGVWTGATEAEPEDVAARIAEGYRLIHLGWDFNLLRRELDERVTRTRKILRKP